jgi:hypothetical protein
MADVYFYIVTYKTNFNNLTQTRSGTLTLLD